MSINLKKSHILGLGIRGSIVSEAAASLGCSVMKTPFNYLGIMVGGNMSLVKSWDEMVHKLTKRLSKWKLKTLSIGGRLTLLKSVLASTPIYNMSIFKVPKTVLNKMENLRRNFFNGIQEGDRKITWVKWHTVLAAKKFTGLGVSSFFALNRGLLAKWAMEMEHYLEYIDNEVWKVIQNGNSKKRISTGKDGIVRVLSPVTAAEIQAVEKERKAKNILLMAIPKEHMRRFHGMDDAKEIWEAIRTRFGGNANSKKMQKAVFKQQFEAFKISNSEGLEKGYDRFQQLLSQ
ncbi:hypothetical protein Tco_1478285, partial [Tanacetum coccineum]